MKRYVLVLFFMLFSVKSFALYEDKNDYPYGNKIFDIYVSLKAGPSLSNSLDKGDISTLFEPQRMLSTSFFAGAIGATVGVVRLETEWGYIYNWHDIIQDGSLYDSSLDTNAFPNKGQQVLKNYTALNAYYDFKNFSDVFYPYIGVGVGRALGKTTFYDVSMQPNGLGEEYYGEGNVGLFNFMVGFEYTTKIIRSTISFEYRYTKASAYRVEPLNFDGTNYINGDVPSPGENYVPPQPRDVASAFHSFVISFKYYLF